MSSIVQKIEESYLKSKIVDVKSGDTVRVHQKIKEGNKERVQVFEGLVIRTKRMKSHTASITVRKIASGVGVEKTYMLHNPLITKVEVVKRSKVRRNFLSYMRQRTGKAARLTSVSFDDEKVNSANNIKEETDNKNKETKSKPEDEEKEDKDNKN